MYQGFFLIFNDNILQSNDPSKKLLGKLISSKFHKVN